MAILIVPKMDGGDIVGIERIEQDVPESIKNAFERHLLYSQYILNDLYFLKISIAGKVAFILLIQGLLDHGGDNSGTGLEIFDKQGEFLDVCQFSNKGICWKNSPLGDGDFNIASLSRIEDEQPMWSEETLTQYALSIERNDSKTRWIMP